MIICFYTETMQCKHSATQWTFVINYLYEMRNKWVSRNSFASLYYIQEADTKKKIIKKKKKNRWCCVIDKKTRKLRANASPKIPAHNAQRAKHTHTASEFQSEIVYEWDREWPFQGSTLNSFAFFIILYSIFVLLCWVCLISFSFCWISTAAMLSE